MARANFSQGAEAILAFAEASALHINRGGMMRRPILPDISFGSGAIFVLALSIGLPIAVWGMIYPDAMTAAVTGFTVSSLTGASWWWLLMGSGFVALSAYFALGPYGRIKLGSDEEVPEFSTPSWLAMLFAAGMGAGLLFWGVAEPITHFAKPPGLEGGTPAAAREAMVITNLHWGLHAWSIYGLCGLVIAYFSFRRKTETMISTPIRALFKNELARKATAAADVLGVVAVVFGLAGSLAMGTLQVRSGLNAVFGLPTNHFVSLAILFVLFVFYMLSAMTGVGKGILILSNVNLLLVMALMVFVLLLGPTTFILVFRL